MTEHNNSKSPTSERPHASTLQPALPIKLNPEEGSPPAQETAL
jgi:hypothetical protein